MHYRTGRFGSAGYGSRLVVATLAAVIACAPSRAQTNDGAEPEKPSTAPRAALEAPLAAQHRLISIASTGNRLVAVGQRGNIVISDDGQHWRQVPSPVNIMLTRVRFLDAQHGWITGYDGTILHSQDGGLSWQIQHYDVESRPLYDILMFDQQDGIAVGGYGGYLVTSDGGKHWISPPSALAELGLHFNMILQLGNGTLFVVGEKSLMAWSTDRGKSWQLLDSPYNGTFFGAVPLGTRGALVYGLRGHSYVTLDVTAAKKQDPASFDPPSRRAVEDPARIAAMGWQPLSGGHGESQFGATRLPDGEILLVGVNGLSQQTRLALARLEAVESSTDATLSDVLVWNDHIIGVGKRGVVHLGPARREQH